MFAVEVTIENSSDTLIGIAAVLAALAAIWRFVGLPALRFCRRLEKVVVNVESQLYPNGGSSLRDAVDRIQKALDVIDKPATTGENPNHHEELRP